MAQMEAAEPWLSWLAEVMAVIATCQATITNTIVAVQLDVDSAPSRPKSRPWNTGLNMRKTGIGGTTSALWVWLKERRGTIQLPLWKTCCVPSYQKHACPPTTWWKEHTASHLNQIPQETQWGSSYFKYWIYNIKMKSSMPTGALGTSAPRITNYWYSRLLSGDKEALEIFRPGKGGAVSSKYLLQCVVSSMPESSRWGINPVL